MAYRNCETYETGTTIYGLRLILVALTVLWVILACNLLPLCDALVALLPAHRLGVYPVLNRILSLKDMFFSSETLLQCCGSDAATVL